MPIELTEVGVNVVEEEKTRSSINTSISDVNRINISVARHPSLYKLIGFVGLKSHRWYYPLFVALCLLWAIVYQVWFDPDITTLPVWVLYYTLDIAVYYFARQHMTREENYHLKTYSIHRSNTEVYKITKMGTTIKRIIGTLFLFFMTQASYISYETFTRVNPFTVLEWIAYITSRFGWIYFYTSVTSIYTYVYYVLLLHQIEIYTIQYKVKVDKSLTMDSFLTRHKQIMRRMRRNGAELTFIIFIGLSVLLSRVPVNIYTVKVLGRDQDLLWMLCNLIIFAIMSWKIAEINRISDSLVSYIYSERVFDTVERSEVKEYLSHNPAYFKIGGFVITQPILIQLFFVVCNFVAPIMYTVFFT